MTSRALIVVMAGLLVVVATAGSAMAQSADPAEPFVGRLVARVTVEIEGRPEPSTDMAALVTVRSGEPLRREDWRSSINRLATRFEQVTVLAVDEPGGLAIRFLVEPRHPIDSLQITGNPGISASALRQLVQDRYGGIPTDERLGDVEAATMRLLADQGYRDARVVATTLETHNPDRATLVLDVAAGPVTRIASLDVQGDGFLPAATVIARAGVQVGAPYRARDIQGRMAAIEESLRRDGYYEASARAQGVRRPDDSGMDVTLLVDAGPRIQVLFAGDPLPGDETDLVPIERNRSADADLLEDSRRRIESRFRADGYRDAQAPFTRIEQADGRLVITFSLTRGPRYRVDSVVFWPELTLPQDVIRGAFGVRPGDPFSPEALLAGAGRVVLAYQELGFYEAAAEPVAELGETNAAGDRLVIVRPRITEGRQANVGEVVFEYTGTQRISETVLRGVMRLQESRPYVLSHGIADQRDLERAYRDRGFPNLVLTITPEFSAEGRDVRLRVTITEGPQIIVGDIVVVGRQQISEAAVREALTLRTGEPLGEAAELESRRRLLDLGIFRRVSITAQDLLPGETVANVLVSVEELPATTVGFGGGLEVGRRPRAATGGGNTDVLELAPRGFFEIGRRNLGGRNRSVNLFSRLALKPRTEEAADPSGPDVIDTSRFGFTEYRITASFREQRAFRTDADLTVDITSEQGVRTLFNFARQAFNASLLRRVSPRVTLSGRYGLDFSRLFDVGIQEADRSLIDRLFPQVRLSILSGGVLWDRRDDPVAPSTGTLMTANLEVAARSLGSEVGYAKTFFQVSAFRPLTDNRRVVFATRGQLGVARGFERTVPVEDALGAPVVDANGQPLTETVADLPASQRFFAGGGTTVRGFQIDRLGVPEILNPNGLSNGGNAVVVLNAELRAVVLKIIGRDLGVVGFTDAGNVFARAGDLDVGRLRATAGLGLRFDSPIGPLRFDVGLKFRRMDVGGRRERGWEYHLSIGEAF